MEKWLKTRAILVKQAVFLAMRLLPIIQLLLIMVATKNHTHFAPTPLIRHDEEYLRFLDLQNRNGRRRVRHLSARVDNYVRMSYENGLY
jgi:hypothetical protein